MDQCLITIHSDNRLRMWDLEDGRCFNISSHFVFPSDEEIISLEIIYNSKNENRYFISRCIQMKRYKKIKFD